MGSVRLRQRIERTSDIRNQAAIDMLRSLPTASVGAIISDPPFFIGLSQTGGMGHDPWVGKAVSDFEAAVEWYKPIAVEAFRVLRPGGASVIMGGSQSIAAWEAAVSSVGFKWMAEITTLWNQGKPRIRNFGSLSMPTRWHVKPGAAYAYETDRKTIYSNVLVAQKVPVPSRLHPSQKPVELTNFFISLLTLPDDVVVDPFCGSGSTLVSAAMCERSFIGSDLDSVYCEIASHRTQTLDNEEAQLRPLYWWANGRLEEVS